jgi:hypothetical protein
LAKFNLERGAPVKKLTIQNGEVFSAEVSDQFTDAKPFAFLAGRKLKKTWCPFPRF